MFKINKCLLATLHDYIEHRKVMRLATLHDYNKHM